MLAQLRFLIFHGFCLFFLLFEDTLTHQSFIGANPIFYYVTLVLVFCGIVSFSGVVSDPGYIPLSDSVSSNFFCNACQIRVPIRAFHCEKCHQCVQNQIFHSDLANICIGIDNRLMYYCLIVSEMLLFLWMIIETFLSFHMGKSTPILLMFILPFNLYLLIQCCILFVQFTYLIVTNSNVLETCSIFGLKYFKFQSIANNPFANSDILGNVSYFFMPVGDYNPESYEINSKTIQQSKKFENYCQDIQHYKSIRFIEDSP